MPKAKRMGQRHLIGGYRQLLAGKSSTFSSLKCSYNYKSLNENEYIKGNALQNGKCILTEINSFFGFWHRRVGA